MRTCGLSHQIMGPTTVKMAKTGFMGKIANLQLEVPYFDRMVQKCACEKSYISIIIPFITQASLKYLQEPATFKALKTALRDAVTNICLHVNST